MFLEIRNKSRCQRCTAPVSGASLPQHILIKTFPIIFLSKPSVFSQRSNDLAILTPGFQLRQNSLLTWADPWLGAINTISTSEIISQIGFHIAKSGAVVWQLDETMMADGCIFREGNSVTGGDAASSPRGWRWLYFTILQELLVLRPCHTTRPTVSRAPQTLVSCEPTTQQSLYDL